MTNNEREVEKCCPKSKGKGECRVPWTGQTTATARCHHQSVGQSVDHSSDDILSQNESRIPRWYVFTPIELQPNSYLIYNVCAIRSLVSKHLFLRILLITVLTITHKNLFCLHKIYLLFTDICFFGTNLVFCMIFYSIIFSPGRY